jgi:hypothetical protein
MEARDYFKTDQLEISFQKFLLRCALASVVHRDSRSLEVKRTEPDAVGGTSNEARQMERAAHGRPVHQMTLMVSKPAEEALAEKRQSKRLEGNHFQRQRG